jgi:predicted permease
MTDVNVVFLNSLIIIALGYLLKRTRILTEENGEIVAKIIFNLTLPAVILKVTSTIVFQINLILLPLISISYGLLMACIGFLIFKKYQRNMKGLLMMSIIGFNVANFSFPLIEGIWGNAGLQLIALVDAGNAFSIFVVCYTMGWIFSNNNDPKKIDFKHISKNLLKSTPLMSYVIALSLNFSGILLPFFLRDLIDIISRANSPLALLLLGIFLNFKFQKRQWWMIGKALLIRYVFGFTFGLFFYLFLPSAMFSNLFRLIIFISLILPVGLAVIPFSVEMKYDKKLITMIVNLSIVSSFLFMWILVLLFNG